MQRRSTNETVGYTHFVGDLTAHVDSSHGVRLSGGSTGGIIESVGDDTAVTLTLRAQGTAGIRFTPGTTSATAPAASTTSLRTIQRYLVQWTVPAIAADDVAETTVTVAGLTTNSILVLSPRVTVNSTVAGVTIHPRCSTVDELTIMQVNVGSTLSGSTQSAYLLQFAF